MTLHRSTQATETTAYLQQAADRGAPAMIPGARELHVQTPERTVVPAAPVGPIAPAASVRVSVVATAAQLERERESGGARSERSDARGAGVLGVLEDWLARGIAQLRRAPAVTPFEARRT